MQHLEQKAQADGITVPLIGNDNGTWNSGRRRARRGRRRLLPTGLQLFQPDEVGRGPGHQLRPRRRQADNQPGVPGRCVRPVGRPRIRQVRAADQRPVRERVLQAEHRGWRDLAELLHDVWRDELGLARRAGELHLIRLRRRDPRDPSARPEVLRGQADRLHDAIGRAAGEDRRDPSPRPTTRRSSTPRGSTPTPGPSSMCCGTTTRPPRRSTRHPSRSTSARSRSRT